MKFRFWFVVTALLFSLSLVGAFAQDKDAPKTPPAEQKATPPADQKAEPDKPAAPAATPPATPPATPAQRETPPDAKALTDALKISDPEKKIEALEKFKKDFPNSSSLTSASSNILTTLTSKMPKQEARIRVAAQLMYDSAGIKDKGRAAGQIADALLNAGIMLEDAQKFAEINLLALDQMQLIKDAKASAERRKQPAPTDEELTKRYNSQRAPRLTLLGRVEVELGHTEQGKALLEESYGFAPDVAATAAALGDLAAKAGDNQKALDYLTSARLGGKVTPSTIDLLASVYKKTHDGSADGLEAMLDAEYHKRYPNPVKVDEYKESEKRSDRLALAEVFTGSGCPPCVGADLAFEAAMERYNRKDLMVVMYHQHVPQPDPMSNPDVQARSKYYAVRGVPTYMVDGKTVDSSGGGRDGSKEIFGHVQKAIETALETTPEAKLKVAASLTGGSVHVKADVDGLTGDSQDLKVHVLLLEKELRYSGENGIRFHPMVVRAMGGEKDDGFDVTGKAASFEQNWDLDKVSAGLKKHLDEYEAGGHRGNAFTFIEKKYQIDRANLAVAVFVQDAKTKHVLQSAFVDLGTEPAAHTTAMEGLKEEK